MTSMNTSVFIERANKLYNFKYDYNNSIYVKHDIKLKIICKIHGEFTQNPYKHLSGKGCKLCGINARADKRRRSLDQFITKASKIHKNKYKYEKTIYVNSYTPICIICPTHGEFTQTPANHLYGKECKKCSSHRAQEPHKKTLESFIIDANLKHNNYYDYTNSVYVNRNKKINITCPKHGEFNQVAWTHLIGCGCPKCTPRISKWEIDVQKNIQAKYPDALFNNRTIIKHTELDIYIPSINTAIECQGDYWHMNPKIYGPTYEHKILKITAKERWEKDIRKHDLIRNLGFNLITLWESDWKASKKLDSINGNDDSIKQLLTSNLSSINTQSPYITPDEWNSLIKEHRTKMYNHQRGKHVYNNGSIALRLSDDLLGLLEVDYHTAKKVNDNED